MPASSKVVCFTRVLVEKLCVCVLFFYGFSVPASNKVVCFTQVLVERLCFFYGCSVPASSNVVCFTRVYGFSVPESNVSCEIQNLTRLRMESLPDVLMHRVYWFILN